MNNGSITYKVYKLPSADITIGLTRLGGVKEVENTVDLSGYVPYTGATQDLNLGNNALKLRDDYEKTNTTTDSDGNQTTTTKTVEQSAYLKLKRGSGDYHPQVIEVKRLKEDGQAISASNVRSLLKEGNLEKVESLVPKTTFDYLLNISKK